MFISQMSKILEKQMFHAWNVDISRITNGETKRAVGYIRKGEPPKLQASSIQEAQHNLIAGRSILRHCGGMTRVRLQVIGKVVCGYAWVKLASKVLAIDPVAIAIADEVVKLANEKL